MRNPFKPRGDAFHQADEWIAPSIGLIGALSRAQAARWKSWASMGRAE